MAESKVPAQKAIEAGHDLTDLSPKNIALFGVSLAAMIIIVLGVSYLLFGHYAAVQIKTHPPPSPLSYTREPTPEPRLAAHPGQDLKAMRAAEDSMLKSYGWIDREKGIVRIPIDRAIEILAQRGLPVRPQSGEAPNGNKTQKGISDDRATGQRN
jgi:hypothetical protein